MTGNQWMEVSIGCIRVLVQHTGFHRLVIIIHKIGSVIIDFVFKNLRGTCNDKNWFQLF